MPAKQTTKHTPVLSLPEGATNSKGWMKIRDKQTGRLKYVNMNIGAAIDNSGDITHERY